MNILNFLNQEYEDKALRIYKLMFNGKLKSNSFNFYSKSGKIIPVETRVWRGNWNGVDCLFGIAKDVSKEKEALQKFTKVFQNNPALMALSDMSDMRFVDVNTSFVEKLGYSYNELVGKTSEKLNLFINLEKQRATGAKLSKNGSFKNIELKVRCKDGSILYGLFSGEIIESDSKKYFLTVMIDITDKRIIEQKFKEQSIRDSLTNIYNRRYIYKKLEDYLSLYIKTGNYFSIAILDIDFFKKINDTYGHIVGDHILIEFTKLLSSFLDKNDFLGRYGGEEFIIVSYNKTKYQANDILCKILKATRNYIFHINDYNINFTFSAGISDTMCIDKENTSVEKIINIADERLYVAKKTGRNKIIINKQ